MNYEVKRLKLFEPLNFSIKENSIQDFSYENEEELVCFTNKVPAYSINPNKKEGEEFSMFFVLFYFGYCLLEGNSFFILHVQP